MALENSRARVRTDQINTSSFKVSRGERQEDALSALLFITSLDRVTKELNHNDDVTIIATNQNDSKKSFERIEQKPKEKGMINNENKTKYIYCNRIRKAKLTRLKIKMYNYEEVETFKYLGTLIYVIEHTLKREYGEVIKLSSHTKAVEK